MKESVQIYNSSSKMVNKDNIKWNFFQCWIDVIVYITSLWDPNSSLFIACVEVAGRAAFLRIFLPQTWQVLDAIFFVLVLLRGSEW
jgi:hypothetical protein